MTVEHIIEFNIALCAALASPGPALLVAIQTTLSSGRRAGIAVGCGLGTMAAIWTLLALLGLETVFRAFPWAYVAAKLLGALYLLYIAWGLWRGAHDAITSQDQPTQRAFRQGVLINALNPKSVLFGAAVLIVIFPSGMTLWENAGIVLNHLGIEVVFYTALAIGMSTEAVKKRYLRAKAVMDRTAAIILGGLGVRLLLSR
ncbi:MAG: LysE family translocator [Paracoccaceae bacterium]